MLLNTEDFILVTTHNKEFRFELNWLINDEFLPLVAKIWWKPVGCMDPIDIINIKLKIF